MEKLDRRVRRTQDLLGNALVELILEKGYEAVTIKDVAERADVAYVTFFRHYRDLDELLVQRLEEMIRKLTEHIFAVAGDIWSPEHAEFEGVIVFRHVRENAALYHILLSSAGAVRVRKRVQQAIATIVLDRCPPLFENEDTIPAPIAANHIASTLLTTIEWWLDNEMPYPPERMAQIYNHLTRDISVSAAV